MVASLWGMRCVDDLDIARTLLIPVFPILVTLQYLPYPFMSLIFQNFLLVSTSLLCIPGSMSHRFLPISFKLIDRSVCYFATVCFTPSLIFGNKFSFQIQLLLGTLLLNLMG